MGQWWKVVGIDGLYSTGGGAKLGEFIFEDQEDLVKAIVKPSFADFPCRPGTPSHYLTSRYYARVPPTSAGKLGLLHTESIRMIFRLLTRPRDVAALASTCNYLWVIGKERLVVHFWDSLNRDDLMKSAGPRFGKLPPELVDLIFDHLDSFEDAFLLGLTSRYMWLGGETRIHRLLAIAKGCGHCAGHRMIAIGDYAKDLPKSLCKPEQFDAIFRSLNLRDSKDLEALEKGTHECYSDWSRQSEQPQSEDSSGSEDTRAQINWEHLSEDPESEADIDSHPSSRCRPILGGDLGREERRTLAQKQRKGLAQGIYRMSSKRSELSHRYQYGPHRRSWFEVVFASQFRVWGHCYLYWKPQFGTIKRVYILRNISKQVYMRSDNPLAKHDQYCGFGRALLVQICWSTDPSASLAYEGPIHRGPWAGDRFDIIPFDPSGLEAKTWRDVTADLLSDLKKIYELEDYWREICDEEDDVYEGGEVAHRSAD